MSQSFTTDLAQFEDGVRVPETGTFEWWYFDAILDDGSTCVVTFLNKQAFTYGALQPILMLNVSPPEGSCLQCVAPLSPASYHASSTHCEVTMGQSRVEGDLSTYRLHAEGEAPNGGGLVIADLELERVVPGFRIGPYLPPEQAMKLWLGEQIVIPSGTVRGTLVYGGAEHRVTGTCYHDHQWGGPTMGSPTGSPTKPPVSSWYWGRAQVGDHAVVFAQVMGTSTPPAPVSALFLLGRPSGLTYDDDVTALSVKVQPGGTDPTKSGLVVDWTSAEGSVRLSLPTRKPIADLGGGYMRYLSPALLTSTFAGESFTGEGRAIWESMSFGK